MISYIQEQPIQTAGVLTKEDLKSRAKEQTGFLGILYDLKFPVIASTFGYELVIGAILLAWFQLIYCIFNCIVDVMIFLSVFSNYNKCKFNHNFKNYLIS